MTVHAHDAPFLEYICIIREGQEKMTHQHMSLVILEKQSKTQVQM